MKIEQILTDLGLTDKEPDVFLALLKVDGIQPASVIAKRADLNRTTVYKTLVKLAKMGLVTKTMQHGITAFFIEDPEKRLETLVEKKRKNVDRLNDQLLTVLPEIKSLKRQELSMPKMRVYDGYAGVIRTYEDSILEENTIYCFENIAKMAPQIQKYMETVFIPRRLDMGNFAYVLSPETEEGKSARKHDKKFLREARFAPKDRILLETGLNVYGDKISFFSYDPDDMFGVILESRAFANSLREIFQFCWQHSK